MAARGFVSFAKTAAGSRSVFCNLSAFCRADSKTAGLYDSTLVPSAYVR